MRLLRRIRTLLHASRTDADIRRELEFHLAMDQAAQERRGMPQDNARRAAVRLFGDPTRVREEVRDTRGITFLDGLRQDVRFGWRALRRTPGYTIAAVAILALGIGADTAMFSVINGVFLKPLPYPKGDQLTLIQESAPNANLPSVGVSIPELTDYRARLQAVQDLVEYHGMSFVLLNQGEPDSVDTGVVSANFFEMLGIQAQLGRTFQPGDDALGAEAVLVLSHEYWLEKFGGDPAVVGRVLQMNDRPHRIVGVLPAHPQYPRLNDVYMPTSACPFRADAQRTMSGGHRTFGGLRVFGRLAPGATLERATSEIQTIAASFARDFPADYKRARGMTGRAVSLQDQLVSGARQLLLTLAATTLLVLIIACANVANLALARMVRRERELAVRTALGAGRRRLLRQLVTESVIVALAGGVLGVGLAMSSLEMLTRFVSRFTPRTGQIDVDATVLLFALTISVLTGLAFGAAPAFAIRRNLISAVREGGAQAGDGRRRQRLRSILVVGQVGVSFVLLVGASLLLHSFFRLTAVPLGYDTSHVITAGIAGNFSNHATNADIIRFQSDVLRRVRESPGVRAAAITSSVPLSNIVPGQQTVEIRGRSSGDRVLQVDPNVASEGYFTALNVPLVDGREFRETDDAEAPRVAVINVSMAKLWAGANPIGSQFLPDAQSSPQCPKPDWLTVVGVVRDFRLYGPEQDVEAQYYTPFRQACFGGGQIIVRGDGNPYSLIPAIKSAVHGIDPESPIDNIKTIEELRGGRLANPQLTAALLSLFAGVALAITLAGLAGVVGTSVSQRTREFGVRMALGASRFSVLRLVIRQAGGLVAAGIGIGVVGAFAFSQLITRFLFATTPTDVAAYGAVALMFVAGTLLATFGPARRATTIDPIITLKAE